MKIIRTLLLAVGMILPFYSLHSQTTSDEPQVLPFGQPLPVGTYWLTARNISQGVSLTPCPPLPAFNEPPYLVYVLSSSNRVYLVDDTSKTGGLNEDQLATETAEVLFLIAQAQVTTAQTTQVAPQFAVTSSTMMSALATAYAYGNPVYLTNMTASAAYDGSMTASFGIGGGTNFVPWDILMSTNLTLPVSEWNWIGIGYTSNNYTFYEQPFDLAFYILAKPSKTMTVGLGDDTVGQCDVPSGLTNVIQVACGDAHCLALKNDNTLVGWGWNLYGQATIPTNLTGVAMVSAGWYHSVALLTNGTVVAWGLNDPSLGYYLTNVPPDLTNATVISAQALHTLALRSDGTVVSWGYNSIWGETNVPAGLTNVTAISAGYGHNLAVSNGYVVAWGYDGYGQCEVPAGLSNVVDVAAGLYNSLALLSDGTVVAWGANDDGESVVPSGLTNVVAIAAGGDPNYGDSPYLAYSMALKSDGTLVIWGYDAAVEPVDGLNNVIALAAGGDHALAVRTGPPTPVITLEPMDQYQVTNGTVTFTSRGAGLYGVTYQWQFNGVDIPGATNATLTVTNVQATNASSYDVVVTDNDGMGSLTSSSASVHLISPPVITSETLPTNQIVLYQSNMTLQVSVSAPGQDEGFPLAYQWQFNGTNIAGITSSNYTFSAVNSGTYSLIVTNAAGSVTMSWQITVVYPGGVIPWGSNSNGQLNASSLLTNVISLAAGQAQGIVALDNGDVTNWGSYWTGTNFIPVTAPPIITNAFAVAAGSRHDLALKADGTVVAWGLNDYGQTNVPADATNIIAIAAGGQQSLALKQDGMVLQWGQTNASLPADLTNVTAIAEGTNFALALLQNSTVVAWGANDFGQTNVPTGLSNVVAIAAGGAHALALRENGTVVAWGDNTYGETNVPAGLTNAMNIAAGGNHSIALKNDGTVICWGDNTYGQANPVSGLNNVKLIAGGGDFTLAVQFSPTVMYSVDVSKDLLLIYNTNSQDSKTVLDYYLAHRPGVADANVLGIGYTNPVAPGYYEIINPVTFTNNILSVMQTWLAANPTKRPQYVILFPNVPSIIFTNTHVDAYPWLFQSPPNYPTRFPSVQCLFNFGAVASKWNPFVTSINMDGYTGTNNCIAYINKLAAFGTNYTPATLTISASASGYGDTNYVVDDVNDVDCGDTKVPNTTNGLAAAGVPSSAILYMSGCETVTNMPHLTNAVNVAGYISWGAHSSLGANYSINTNVVWSGNSSWWVIETIESFNGEIDTPGQGNFVKWFSGNAFGGTNYQNTPIGAVSHVDEPTIPGANNSAIYFGLWASGKNLAVCAWNSIGTTLPPYQPPLQVVGDPFVTR